MKTINLIIQNWDQVLLALNAALAAGIAIALLIPGPQPEKALQKVLDVLKNFSKK